MNKIILITICMGIASNSIAGGYRVALQGQKALGMGHTGVAMHDSAETVFFNPSGMSFLDSDESFVGGVTLIDSTIKYQNQTTNTSAETDNPIGTPIGLYYAKKVGSKTSYGIGVYTPYGNTVEWDKDWAGSHLVNNIELKTIYIQPTISFKIDEKHSFGFGPIFVTGNVEFNRNLSTSLADANGNRSNVTIKANGVTALGFNVGFTGKPTNDLTLGISYRTNIELLAKDEVADFQNIPTSLAAVFPDTTFSADLILPAELTIGISYNLNASTQLAIDINRTFWSKYKNLNVLFNNGAGLSLNPRNYEDANIYRVGVQHSLNNKITLRGGMYVDISPIQDGFYTPESPRQDSTGYTAGASYKMSNQVELDFSLLILTFDEFNGSYDHYDQSGTLISFGGDYQSEVTIFGFGLNYTY